MGKNRKYRDYTNYGQTEEKNEPIVAEEEELTVEPDEEANDLEAIVETVKAVRDLEPDEKGEYTFAKEEEGDPSLEVNTFKTELKKGKISCPKLRVRTSASAADDKNIMGIFEQGTPVTILQDQGEWLFIEISKNSIKSRGFVMSKFITIEE